MTRLVPTNSYPDELNLARYFQVVRRQWHLILLCGALGAAALYLWGTLQPKMYSARVDVAIVRIGTIVSFDPTIRTVSDTDPTSQSVDAVSRRSSLLAVGSSVDLASRVVQALGTQLPDDLQNPARLLKRLTVTNDADLFSFVATADNPELAALIANGWANEYVARVNSLFSEHPSSENVVKAQAAQAKQEYDTAQAALVTFLQANPIETLKRRQALLSRQLDTQVAIQNKLFELAADVQALRSRLSASGATASSADQLSQIVIQASAFNNGGDVSPLQIDVSLLNSTPLTTQEQLAQLDALAKAIEQRRGALTAEQEQSLYTQLNTVQAQLEQSQQQLKNFQAARDLAWDTYQKLNSKIVEVQVASGSENQVVQIASPAIVPTLPLPTRRLVNTLIGGALGLVLGFVLALLWDFQRGRMRVLKPAPQ